MISNSSSRGAGEAMRLRLEVRHEEIEQAVLTRIQSIAEPAQGTEPAYLEGLRAAAAAAIEYGLAGVGSSERNPPPVPPALLVQARLAARNGVSLDTVLRRYFAGYALLGDYLIEEAEGLAPTQLGPLVRTQAALFDRLLAVVSEEHSRESEARPGTAEERRAAIVKRLLSGERLDPIELAYDLQATHVGLVAEGPEATEAIGELAAGLDCRLLAVPGGEGTAWGWIGARRSPDLERLEDIAAEVLPPETALAIGEPGHGPGGWNRTHRQAKAALPVALRGSLSLVRYADVALLASARQDEVLVASLRQLYLEPLAKAPDGGATLRETLRAYFTAERNVSSAAAALGVSRQTVTSRLRAIEERLGRSLDVCAAQAELALQLESSEQGDISPAPHHRLPPALSTCPTR